MADERRSVASGFIWRFLERCGAQGMSLVVSIILARMLMPEAYGTVALLSAVIAILQVFVDSGLGTALIQKKNADDLDFSTVFYFNIGLCTVLYLGMFIASPFIAEFYGRPELTSMMRVLSLTLVVSGLRNVQQAYVSRKMMFKKFFWATLGGTVFSAVLGIWMAYKGYGAWALVAQNLSNVAIGAVVLWFIVRWRPKLMFSFERLKGLFSFGWKLLASNLVNTVYIEIRQLIIGKMYSSEDLAYYNKGSQYPKTIVTNINSSIDSVLLPVMSKSQDSKEALKMMVRRSIKISTYVMAPLLLGLAFVSDNFVVFLLTENWLPLVPYMCIFCITYLFQPIHTANLNAINAMGRSDLFLKLEIIKKTVGIITLLATMWFGPMVMAYSLLVTTVISQMVNAWPNRRLLDYTIFEQWLDIAPNLILAGIMGVAVWLIGWLLHLSPGVELLIQVPVGIIVYVGGSVLCKMDSFGYVLSTAKSLLGRNKK